MSFESDLVRAVKRFPEGATRLELQQATGRRREPAWKFRKVLAELVARGLLRTEGTTRSRRYFPSAPGAVIVPAPSDWTFSADGAAIVATVRRPLSDRTPCSYERAWLDAYRPNHTFLLDADTRRELLELGRTADANQPAGTYARHVLERLLIDLSWNSSRLEGNTYSLLDTERLFRERAAPEGRPAHETQMLLNHRQAIEFLVEGAGELRPDVRTLRTVHGMLAENLLPDAADEGRLRRIAVGISESVYVPLAVPQLIEEILTQLVSLAQAIEDPFEQSFFLLVHVPYLQPFSDVNKRVSRLVANLPLLKHNLQPLAFVDVPREAYALATLGVYEQRRAEALRDVYVWAYRRSAQRYRAIRQSLGEPDAFRLKHREALREVVRTVVQELPPPAAVAARIAQLAEALVASEDRKPFNVAALRELELLNEGTFARYRLRPSEFEAWRTRSG